MKDSLANYECLAESSTGFLGPNRAGKTTTIRLLLGLLRPTRGTILLNGELLTQERRELRRRIGALVETPSLHPHLTGQENLEVTRRILKLPRSRVADTLALSGLTADANRVVRTYSLGNSAKFFFHIGLKNLLDKFSFCWGKGIR